jgi:nucleotide-binding universal stress UspA family protein
MSVKILVALDDSEGALAAVDYVARTFGRTPDIHITLLHILPGLPAALWDDGHILNEEERENRQRQINIWKERQEKNWRDVFNVARKRLEAGGVPPNEIKTEFIPVEFDVADEILNFAEKGRYGTIVVGRRGLTGTKKILLGSISSKIVHYAKDRAVTVVE